MLVERGIIKAIGLDALDPQAVVWDLSPYYLSPAPLDAHVHLWLGGDPKSNLRAAYLAGIAAVRDLGNPNSKARPISDANAPLVISSGTGMGSSWLATRYEGPEAYARATRERIEKGADFIKVFLTGLLDFESPGKVQEPQALTPAELEAIVSEASRAGLKVAVHASGSEALRAAIQAGVDCIEHGYFMDDELLQKMAQSGIAWSPTLAAVLAHADDLQCRHLGVVRENIRKIAEMQMSAMRRAQELGVNMVLGTDAGSYGLPHGRAVYLEMASWLEAGISPQNLYEAATKRAAVLLNLENELGSIKVGARAWLMATREDPARNPLTLQNPVWRGF